MLEAIATSDKNINLFSKTNDLPQILALCSASLMSLATGAFYAFVAPAIPKLLSEYNFTIEEASYLIVIPPVAMLFATPIFCRLADQIGRKYTLLSGGIFNMICWILFAFARNLYVFYISRAILGICEAVVYASLPAYIAEVSTPRVRSLYGNMMAICSLIGQFLANCIGFYFSIQHASLIMLLLPVLFIVSFAFMPETPYYLVMAKKQDAAEKSLKKLRHSEYVQDELRQIIADVDRQLSESARFKDLWLIKSNRKALIVANMIRTFQQFSGCGAIVPYSQYIFQIAGGDLSSGVAGMIIIGTFTLANFFANLVCDKLGRRPSIVISCLGCGITLFMESVYFYLQTYEIVDVSIISWFPVCGLVMYAMVYSLGLGIVPSIIVGEIFSTNIRKHAATVTNMIFSIYLCTLAKIFQLMMTSHELWVPFLFFSLACLVSSVVAYFVVPETKGKTLEEIQQTLKEHK